MLYINKSTIKTVRKVCHSEKNVTELEAFRRDSKGIEADPSKCGPHSLRFWGSDYVGLPCCQRYSVSATRSLEVDASHRHILAHNSNKWSGNGQLWLQRPFKHQKQLETITYRPFRVIWSYSLVIYVWIYENGVKNLNSRIKRAFFSRQKLSPKSTI